MNNKINFKKVILFGIIIWLIFLLIRIGFFPLKGRITNIVDVLELIVIIMLTFIFYYIYNIQQNSKGIEGVIWYLIIVILDMVFFKMLLGYTLKIYFYEYGLRMIIVPLITISVNKICEKCKK